MNTLVVSRLLEEGATMDMVGASLVGRCVLREFDVAGITGVRV
jgi:hypothetical protein